MIKEEQLDAPLAVICFHNIERNQDFDTDWISDMTNEQIREMVLTLNTYGYITYKKRKKTKLIGAIIAIIASLATIAAFIFQLLSK